MPNIDHLLYACARLERGMDEVEDLLGSRPVLGGRHPAFGTHNALLAIGPSIYLEIIARDPSIPVPPRGALIDLAEHETSRLATWAVRTNDIASLTKKISAAGISLGETGSGSRETPHGEILRWTLTDLYAMPMAGAVPFLIDWGDTPHPTASLPSGGQLRSLRIGHPQAEQLRDLSAVIGVNFDVSKEEFFRLTAEIETANGLVTLE